MAGLSVDRESVEGILQSHNIASFLNGGYMRAKIWNCLWSDQGYCILDLIFYLEVFSIENPHPENVIA